MRALVRTNAGQSAGHLEGLPPEIRREVEIVWGDVRDGDAARAACAGRESVLHLAALISIPFSYERPEETASVNHMGTLGLLRAARDAGVGLFVQTSTSEVYGSAQTVPMTESHPLQAQSPYAASKIAADQTALAFHRTYGLPVAVLRPFNTYGPRQSARAVIPLVLSQILHSDRVRMGSLTPRRDYTFVTDTARAFVSVLESDRPPIGETLHFGSGASHTIGEVVAWAMKVSGRDLPIESDPSRIRPSASEVERLECDASAFRARTGWAPKVGMEEGLRATWEWLRARPEVARHALGSL